MARKPYKHIIHLTEEERNQLKALVRSGTTQRRLADRARMILWADEGVTLAETQRRLGCSEQIVINWRRDFLDRRWQGAINALADRPRPGRPMAFSPSATSDGQSHRL